MKSKLDTFQENVQTLSQITSAMAEAPICGIGPPRVFKVKGGKARVWILHERPTVTIAKAHLSANAEFIPHRHQAIEFIVLFEGSAVYESGNIRKHLFPGVCVSVPKGKPHRVVAGPEGAWFSLTTVPREEGLGNG